MPSEKWDRRFLELAKHVAQWSKDPSTKVGAVIVDNDKRIVSVGYNGFPKGVKDRDDRLLDRTIKYQIVVHAEVNALLFAGRSVKGCTLYTWPFLSCSSCTSMCINAGIERIATIDNFPDRWAGNLLLSQVLYREAQVEVTLLEDLK